MLSNIVSKQYEQSLSNEKRKQQGIFYTPEEIVQYIVNEAIGGWFEDRKRELKKEFQIENKLYWEKYFNIIKNIKILDPSCGCGDFLIIAFNYLKNEFQKIINIIDFQAFDIDKNILQNNLFGVDINRESVEITKSTLLKTGKTDCNIDYNIQCGNTLIDSDDITEKSTFNWNNNFKTMMQSGGFDVIVGNPPYVGSKEIKNKIIYKNYRVAISQFDLYSLFIEKSIKLLNINGFHSFIVPDSILGRNSFSEIRKIILSETNLISIFQLDDVFEDANVSSCIYVLSQNNYETNKSIKYIKAKNYQQFSENNSVSYYIEKERIRQAGQKILFIENEKYDLISKINSHKSISEIAFVWRGEEMGKKSDKITCNQNSNSRQLIAGENITRYEFKNLNKFINYKNIEKNIENYEKEKIVTRQLGEKINANLDNNKFITTQSAYNLTITDINFHIKYVLGIMNSKVIQFIYKTLYAEKQLFPRILIENIKELSIPIIDRNEQQAFVEKVELILEKKMELQIITNKFSNYLSNNYNTNYNRINWSKITDNQLLKELSKSKINISVIKKNKLLQYFNEQKIRATKIISELDIIDNEIDRMVYKLYKLNQSEIDAIENN